MGKVRKELFDFTMRSYDRAKIRELGGPYLLNQLRNVIGKNGVGLCRGDGSAAIDNENGPKLDRIRKDIVLSCNRNIFLFERLSTSRST